MENFNYDNELQGFFFSLTVFMLTLAFTDESIGWVCFNISLNSYSLYQNKVWKACLTGSLMTYGNTIKRSTTCSFTVTVMLLKVQSSYHIFYQLKKIQNVAAPVKTWLKVEGMPQCVHVKIAPIKNVTHWFPLSTFASPQSCTSMTPLNAEKTTTTTAAINHYVNSHTNEMHSRFPLQL